MAHSLFPRLRASSSHNFRRWPAVLLLGAVLLSTACHQVVTDPNDPKFIVAEKGPWQYTRGQLDGEVTTFLQMNQTTADQLGKDKMLMLDSKMLDYVVLNKLVADKAATLQITDADKQTDEQLDQLKQRIPPGQDFGQILKQHGVTLDLLKKSIREQILLSDVLKAEAFKNDDPTEQEIEAVYMQNKESFIIPAKVRASRILVHLDDKISPADKAAKKKIIDKAYARVMHGEEVGKVAAEMSEDRGSAPNGGDLGFFPKNVSEPGFDEVAFTTKVGAVSPVFETPLGYEFIKVTDSQPAGLVSVADAREKIADYLRQTKRKQEQDDYIKKLLASGGVTYHLFAPKLTPDSGGAQAAPADGSAPDASAPQAAPAPEANTPQAAPQNAPDAPAPH